MSLANGRAPTGLSGMHHHTHGDDDTATVPTSITVNDLVITGTIPDTILVDMAMVNGERVSIPTSITVNDTVPDTILVDMATFNGERVTVPETIFVDMAMSSVPFSAYRFSDLGAYHITHFIRLTQILLNIATYCRVL